MSTRKELIEAVGARYRVGKERIRLSMQRHWLRAKGRRRFTVTTDSARCLPVAPDPVQRRFDPQCQK